MDANFKTNPILVYCPAYNEEQFIGRLIESVLNQSFDEFIFIVSDNHSTDGTRSVIEKYKDSRLKVVMPPSHLTSLRHGKWLADFITINYSHAEFSVYVGGHDIWSTNYLQVLTQYMLHNQGACICYTDTFEIDAYEGKLRRFPNNLNTVGVKKALRPIVVTASLTHNVIFGGLWRESVRKKVTSVIPVLAGVDHLLIARASLYGDVVYAPGAFTHLRAIDGAGNWDTYCAKHLQLSRDDTELGFIDFAKQLSYAIEIQKEAVIGDKFHSQKPILDSLCTSMVVTYLSRNYPHLEFFSELPRKFFDNEQIRKAFQGQMYVYQNICKFIEDALNQGSIV